MSRRTLAIILFVSLAVNVFMIGAVVGGLVMGERFRHERPTAGRGGPPLWNAANQLPPEQRRAYRALLRGEGGVAREGMREAHMARAAAWRGLAAQPFDPAVAKRDLGVARMREMQIRAGIEDRIIDYAAGLPPAERATLAAGLAEPRPQPGKRRPERPAP